MLLLISSLLMKYENSSIYSLSIPLKDRHFAQKGLSVFGTMQMVQCKWRSATKLAKIIEPWP